MPRNPIDMIADEVLASPAAKKAYQSGNKLPSGLDHYAVSNAQAAPVQAPVQAASQGVTPYDAFDYRTKAMDWYDSGIDAEGNLTPDMLYNPELMNIDNLEQMSAYDFDPLRNQSMDKLKASEAGAYQGALTNMAASGGLTAADRMNLASSFNRGRLGSQAGLMSELGIAEGENVWETDMKNKELINSVTTGNLDLTNQAQIQNLATLQDERRYLSDLSRDLYAGDQEIERFDESVSAADRQAAKIEAAANKSKPGGLLGGKLVPGIL